MSGGQGFSSAGDKGGLWRIDGDRLVCLEPSAIAPATVLAPSERVLTLAVDLPLATRRQRLTALPFALEDRLAEPLEMMHVALGAELSPGRFLAGAVRRDVMAEWAMRLDEAGLGRAALVPDAFALPVPDPGGWTVQRMGERVLVRTADGPGFAIPMAMLASAWTSEGRPPITSSGDTLPAEFAASAPLVPYAWEARRGPYPLDLRQGLYSGRSRPVGQLARRLAGVVGAGMLALTIIGVLDTVALQNVARHRHDRALALMRQVAPSTPADADLVAILDRLLPSEGAGASSFFPLLARASAALRPVQSGLAVHSLAYGEGVGLTLDLETADMAGLQRIQTALTSAGLSPSAGPATAENGHATGQFVVRDADRAAR